MPVRDTSLIAFQNILHTLSRRQAQVYFAFKDSPQDNLTDGELSKILRLPINSITGRRGELEKLGVIIDVGRRRCSEPPYSLRHCWKLKEVIKYET